MALAVPEVWASIKSCLGALNDKQSAAALAGLLPGATDASIAAAEAKVGFPFPEQLKALLRANDGQREDQLYEFPGAPWMRLLPVSDIVATHSHLEAICRMCEEEWGQETEFDYRIPGNYVHDSDAFPGLAHNDKWLPFAECANGEGGAPLLWLIDCDPGAGADPGRVIAFGCEDMLGIWAPDLHALLEDILRELQAQVAFVAGGKEQGKGRRLPAVRPRIWYQYLSIEEDD